MGTKDKQQSKMQDSLISQSLFTSFSSSLGSSFADTSISLSKGGGSGGGGGGGGLLLLLLLLLLWSRSFFSRESFHKIDLL